MSLTIISSTQLDPKATKFGEITQNNGYYAVQGHSRSPILVPILSPYAKKVDNTNLHPISYGLQSYCRLLQ